MEANHYDAIILGAGPAGLTAAAGDTTAKRFRQVTTAVADGTIAALAAASYLNELKVKHKQLITF
jgi:thioredoxin reductase